MDDLVDELVDDDETPSIRRLKYALSKKDEDEVLSVALEDSRCNDVLLRLILDRLVTFPRMASVVRHMNTARFPIVALDVLCEQFPEHPSDPDLIEIACNFVRGVFPGREAIIPLITSAVCRGVLSFMESRVSDRVVISNVSRVIRDYSLIDVPYFRTHDGITHFVGWLAITVDDAIVDVVVALLASHPQYIYHCPTFSLALFSLIFREDSHSVFLTRLLFSKDHVVPCVITMVRNMSEDGFSNIWNDVYERIGHDAFMGTVVPVWPSRFGFDDPEEGTFRQFECPITLSPIKIPCVASDGFTYEQSAIMEILSRSNPSPMTREPLDIRVYHRKN